MISIFSLIVLAIHTVYIAMSIFNSTDEVVLRNTYLVLLSYALFIFRKYIFWSDGDNLSSVRVVAIGG